MDAVCVPRLYSRQTRLTPRLESLTISPIKFRYLRTPATLSLTTAAASETRRPSPAVSTNKGSGSYGIGRLKSNLPNKTGGNANTHQQRMAAIAKKLISALEKVETEADFEPAISETMVSGGQNMFDWHNILDSLYTKLTTNSKITSGLYINKKPHEVVMMVFRHIQKEPWFHPSPEWYTKIILLMGWAKQTKLAWDLVIELQDAGCRLTTMASNALIRSLVQSHLHQEAHQLLLLMKQSSDCQPNLRTYNVLIEAKCQAGKPCETGIYLQEMAAAGLRADEFTYASLIEGFLREDNEEAVRQLLQAAIRRRFVIRIPVTIMLVQYFGRKSDWKTLDSIWWACKQPAWKTSVKVWNNFMWAYSKEPKLDKMMGSKSELLAAGFEVNVVGYTSMFIGYKKARDPNRLDEMKALWLEFTAKQFPLNVSLTKAYAYAMMAFGSMGSIDLMAEAFYVSLERGCPPATITCSTFVKEFAIAGYIEEMETAFEMLRQVSSMNYKVQGAMVEAYLRVGEDVKAELVRKSNHWFIVPENAEDESDSDTEL